MPIWQDCAWQRQACEKLECRLCGFRIKIESEMMVDFALAETEIGKKVANEVKLEKEAAQEAQSWGEDETIRGGFSLGASRGFEAEFGLDADGPDWADYPLVKTLRQWLERLHAIAVAEDKAGAEWLKSKAGAELLWYANLIPVKTGRLTSDRADLEKFRQDAELDYNYTRYVLAQCLMNVDVAFTELGLCDDVPSEFESLHRALMKFVPELMDI